MSEDNDIQALMGFSGFGEVLDILIFFLESLFCALQSGKKTAMKFDLEKLFEETKRTAKAYSQTIAGKQNEN